MKLSSALRVCLPLSALMLAAGLALPSARSHAQTLTTITANPNAQRLHEIWRLRGAAEQDRVGLGATALGDINGDSIGDFAVNQPRDRGWTVYYGQSPAPSFDGHWKVTSFGCDPDKIVAGDFWGTGHRAVGITRDSSFNGACLLRLCIYRSEHDSLEMTPSAIFDSKQQFCLNDMVAADLDGDGVDELILTRACDYPEIWIYKGGPNFQVDTPTVVIRDSMRLASDGVFKIATGDFDHDGFIDLLTGTHRRNAPQQLAFFFGSPGSPWNWTHPDRIIDLTRGSFPQVYLGFASLDCDGDGASDLVFTDEASTCYLYRSHNTWKSPRTRSFSFDDADRAFTRPGYGFPVALGALNDSGRRFAMTGILGPSEDDPTTKTLLAFSGSPDGPDAAYDAVFSDDIANLFAIVAPVGDVNADGWTDLLCAHSGWYEPREFGIAIVLSGGPYIPRDSATSSVRDIALESHTNALSLWPMPMHEVLNIAWRGDLRHMPRRFEVHDMDGRLIAGGAVDAMAGSALWRCADAPAGAYLLAVFDEQEMITSTCLIKE